MRMSYHTHGVFETATRMSRAMRLSSSRYDRLLSSAASSSTSTRVNRSLLSLRTYGRRGKLSEIRARRFVSFRYIKPVRAHVSRGVVPNEMAAAEVVQIGELPRSSAHWVMRDVVAWRKQQTDAKGVHYRFKLHSSYDAALVATTDGVLNAETSMPLHVLNRKEQFTRLAKFPHLFGCTLLQLDEPDLLDYPKMLKSQLWMSCETPEGKVVDVTGVQMPGVLDEVFTFDGPLGYQCHSGNVDCLRIWAPTAHSVDVLSWETARNGEPEVLPMQPAAGGVWEVSIPTEWLWRFYKFRLHVYCPWSLTMETFEVTDPYSRGLSANGERSQFVDLDHSLTKPENWDTHAIPDLRSFSDISVYELHVRDFSVTDDTVPSKLQGKFGAFNADIVKAQTGAVSNGLDHLMKLKSSGMTHIHLLPVYDFASVPERDEEQLNVTLDLTHFSPASEEQQKAVIDIADRDGFNWGYDPVHFGVPDGSYATDPDGITRLREFREMIMGLHQIGYRVVLDVVYNHTFEGESERYSVFDKAVPGYYHR